MRRNTSFSWGGMWRKTSHAKTWLTNCSLSWYSTSFLKWVHCPLSAAGCAQTSRFANLLHSIQLRLGKMPASYFMTAPVRPGRCRYLQNHQAGTCRQLIVERVRIYAMSVCLLSEIPAAKLPRSVNVRFDIENELGSLASRRP